MSGSAEPLPLLAIPGALCTGALYPGLAALAAPGEGRAVIPDRGCVQQCAEEVLEQAPPRFRLVGTSFGAQIALEVALAAPERVAGLCLIGVNSGSHPNPPGVEELARSMPHAFEPTVTEFADECIHAAADPDGAARATFIEMAAAIGPERFARQLRTLGGRPDRTNLLTRLRMPVLLLWGEQDRVTPLERTGPFLERVANCTLITIPHCGHLPTLEQPAEATSAFREWQRGSGLV